MASVLVTDRPVAGLEQGGTLVMRVPTAVEALSLMTDVRFRQAVKEAIIHTEQFWKQHRPGFIDVAVRYLIFRYQVGWTVEQIRQQLGVNTYQMRQVAAVAHWYVWERLHDKAPDLATTFGHYEKDVMMNGRSALFGYD